MYLVQQIEKKNLVFGNNSPRCKNRNPFCNKKYYKNDEEKFDITADAAELFWCSGTKRDSSCV